ncbi:50S ribosomal protein L9 [Tautonia marina]|uniref:50S ribosomal protein L9 n=1 Tax=Tautonia marina TaxID=2653855 RepID=UPI001260AF9E|nr:50S ribosomal protein L9 [Tautonia marina]
MAKTPSKTKQAKAAAKAARAKSHTQSQSQAAQAILGTTRRPGWERRHNHPTRPKNGYMHVLLTNKVAKLGEPGDLVKVRPGYARNFLLPQGLATFATPHNLRIVEKHRSRLKALEEAKRSDLQNLAAQLSQRSITIEANANEEGHLYGSVNAQQIAAALATDGVQIDAESVRIEGPLKELGFYSIPIHLGMEITGEVKLWVVPTHVEGDEGGA